MIYWWACGFNRQGDKWMIDLGVVHIVKAHSDAEPGDDAIRSALDELKEISDKGWYKKASKTVLIPARNGVDTGYRADVLRPWLNINGGRWQAIKGTGGRNSERMTGKHLEAIDGLLSIKRQIDGHPTFFVHVDEAKARIQDSFLIPRGTPGYHALPNDLLPEFAFWTFHMIAEQRETTFDSRRGLQTVFIVKKRNNHELDCGAYIIALGEFQIRLLNFKDQQAKEPAETPTEKTNNQSDGINRSY
jgi:phage terminase large subunit GpA-like protein